jgi:hypothetical protein
MTFTPIMFEMIVWTVFFLGCLVVGAVSLLGAASGLIGVFLISISLRCVDNP